MEVVPKREKKYIQENKLKIVRLAGIEISFLIESLKAKIEGYYVSNIYGINKNTLLFKLHHSEKPEILLMFSSFGFWESKVKISPIETNKLLKRLRSDLLRMKITKIEQIGIERIVYFHFSGFGKNFILIGEFFGDGNIILCNPEKKILALLHSIDVRHRKIKIGLEYIPPPPNGIDVFKMSINDFNDLKSSQKDSSNWVGKNFGFPSRYAEEIFDIASINPKTKGMDLLSEQINKIFDSIKVLTQRVITGKHNPVIIKTENSLELFAIKPKNLEQDQFKTVNSFEEGIDELFTKQIIKEGTFAKQNSYSGKFEDLKNRLEEQKKAIEVVNTKSKKISEIANLIQSLNYQGISSISDPAVLPTLKQNNCSLVQEKGINYIEIENTKIKISITSSLQSIASSLFNEAKKQKAATETINENIQNTEKEIEKVKNSINKKENEVTSSTIRKNSGLRDIVGFILQRDV